MRFTWVSSESRANWNLWGEFQKEKVNNFYLKLERETPGKEWVISTSKFFAVMSKYKYLEWRKRGNAGKES